LVAARWNPTDGPVRLPSAGQSITEGRAISRDGNVVVGTDSMGVLKWTGTSNPERKTRPSGAGSNPGAPIVSGDGSTIYAVDDQGVLQWKTAAAGSYVFSGRGRMSEVATNVSGSVLVGSYFDATPKERAFYWTSGGGFVSLDDGGLGIAHGVSSNANRIVGQLGDKFVNVRQTACFWDGASSEPKVLMSYLADFGVDVAPWAETVLYEVSDDGKIALGSGVHAGVAGEPGFLVVFP
jgi:hypothetical protein